MFVQNTFLNIIFWCKSFPATAAIVFIRYLSPPFAWLLSSPDLYRPTRLPFRIHLALLYDHHLHHQMADPEAPENRSSTPEAGEYVERSHAETAIGTQVPITPRGSLATIVTEYLRLGLREGDFASEND